MSHYDILSKRHTRLNRLRNLIMFTPSFVLVFAFVFAIWDRYPLFLLILPCCIGLLLLARAFDFLFNKTISLYRTLLTELEGLEEEMVSLKQSVAAIYERYRSRLKGEQFKKAYQLAGKRIENFEQRLAVGMSREEKEVFVTAFVADGKVVRVTASIGSALSCSNADDPSRWSQHAERLNCSEIRQYHNHPVSNNKTRPSHNDYRTSAQLTQLLGQHAPKLRSFIIFWNEIREWRIIEYDEKGKHWLAYEFDVAAQ